MKFLNDNWATILVLTALLPTIATALTKAPKDGGALAWVQWLFGLLSLLRHQSLSLPGMPVAPAPTGTTPAPAPAPAPPKETP